MAKGVARLFAHVFFSQACLLFIQQFLVFLCVGLEEPELLEEAVVHEDLQVLHVVVGLVAPLELLLRLPRVYALENA
jgi:hypothetical protein